MNGDHRAPKAKRRPERDLTPPAKRVPPRDGRVRGTGLVVGYSGLEHERCRTGLLARRPQPRALERSDRLPDPVAGNNFDAATGSWTIVLDSPLPAISTPIDHHRRADPAIAARRGTTHPVVEITRPALDSGRRTHAVSAANTVRGLVIDGFQGAGLVDQTGPARRQPGHGELHRYGRHTGQSGGLPTGRERSSARSLSRSSEQRSVRSDRSAGIVTSFRATAATESALDIRSGNESATRRQQSSSRATTSAWGRRIDAPWATSAYGVSDQFRQFQHRSAGRMRARATSSPTTVRAVCGWTREPEMPCCRIRSSTTRRAASSW